MRSVVPLCWLPEARRGGFAACCGVAGVSTTAGGAVGAVRGVSRSNMVGVGAGVGVTSRRSERLAMLGEVYDEAGGVYEGVVEIGVVGVPVLVTVVSGCNPGVVLVAP